MIKTKKKNNNKNNINDLFEEIQQNLVDFNNDDNNNNKNFFIPDIITFCEGKEWLALPHHLTNPINLYPVQKLILKIFYRGSIGNENLRLTEEELDLCRKLNLDNDDNGNVIEKYNNNEIFKELVLVWGRRSSKDFLSSLIATYEAMKILECEGGDPYALYELSSANTINILTIANSGSQAHIAFEEIKDRVLNSPYFQDKFIKDGISSSSIYLLTPKDKLDNKKFKFKKMSLKKGSIGIIVGHSNSDTLLGIGCIVLILDEVASYKMTSSSSSGDRIYAALTPTISTYCKKIYEMDENGKIKIDENDQKIVKKRIYDGKIISISSPRAPEGKFYELFNTANEDQNRLVCRLATWNVNPTHTRESLRKEYKTMSEEEFNMEFGAQFSGLIGENFFLEEYVNKCFHNELENKKVGVPGFLYFAHLDPASTSHNYALVVVHREIFINPTTKKSDFIIIVDHIKHWHPVPEKPIDIFKIEEYILTLKKRFRLGMITYDAFHSQESILRMRKAGIPNKMTRFTMRYKMMIYNELEQLINSGRLWIPNYYLLKQEMLELQRKYTPIGFKIYPRREGDGVKSNDIVDSLAGACFGAINFNVNRLPRAKTVHMPTSMNQNVIWRNMQGGYYLGTGQQITHQLEQRASWPQYKR